MSSSLVIHMTLGPFFGVLVTMSLYGVFCTQIFHYATNHASSDRRYIKWLVPSIWTLETLHTCFSIHFIQYYLITQHNNPQAGCYIVWSMGAAYISGFLVAGMVDLFFVWRIWKLSKQALICICLAVFATTRTGIAISNASLSFKYTNALKFFNVVQPTLILEWILSAFTDSMIAITQCYYLHKQRSGIKSTDLIINKLLLYTINTGIMTSLFALLVIIIFVAIPDTMDYAAFVQVQSKLYAVSMLASLNARRGAAEAARRTDIAATSIDLLAQYSVDPAKRDEAPSPQTVVHIETYVEVEGARPSGSSDSAGETESTQV